MEDVAAALFAVTGLGIFSQGFRLFLAFYLRPINLQFECLKGAGGTRQHRTTGRERGDGKAEREVKREAKRDVKREFAGAQWER